MVTPQSRPSPSETATVTQARPERTEQVPGTNSEKASLHDHKVPTCMGDAKDRPTCGSTNIKTVRSGPIAWSLDLLQSKSPRSMGPPQDDEGGYSINGSPGWDLNDLLSPKGTGWAGKTIHSAQVEPAASSRSPKVQLNLQQSHSSNEVWHALPPGDPDKDQRVARTVGCTTAPTKAAKGKEAASAQVVKRGHQVTIVEVPDEDNDISFQRWLAMGSPTISPKPCQMALLTPPETPKKKHSPLPNKGVGLNDIRKNEVTSPMVAKSLVTGAKVQEVPHRWMKPFEVDWMLQAVQEAHSDNAAHTALCTWIHKDRLGELDNELLDELKKGREIVKE